MAEGDRNARKRYEWKRMMTYRRLTPRQLESKALDLLRKFDQERLDKPKPLDAYEVIEKCLKVEYDWKYLSPDQSILGASVFADGYMWVWEKPYYEKGMKPQQIFLKDGTILIDRTVSEGNNRGRENFTVMHEVFHQILHRQFFTSLSPDFSRSELPTASTSKCQYNVVEYEANTCAAHFLMPRKLVLKVYDKMHSGIIPADSPKSLSIAYRMADDFNVSPTAMRLRLMNLGRFVENTDQRPSFSDNVRKTLTANGW